MKKVIMETQNQCFAMTGWSAFPKTSKMKSNFLMHKTKNLKELGMLNFFFIVFFNFYQQPVILSLQVNACPYLKASSLYLEIKKEPMLSHIIIDRNS